MLNCQIIIRLLIIIQVFPPLMEQAVLLVCVCVCARACTCMLQGHYTWYALSLTIRNKHRNDVKLTIPNEFC